MKTHWQDDAELFGCHHLCVDDMLTGFHVVEAVPFGLLLERRTIPKAELPDVGKFLAKSPHNESSTTYDTLSAAQSHCESMYQLWVDLGMDD
jgi:hypothetical protein